MEQNGATCGEQKTAEVNHGQEALMLLDVCGVGVYCMP